MVLTYLITALHYGVQILFIIFTSFPQKTISTHAQTFWLQWVEAAFPDLDSRAYFLPPVHVNPVTTGQSSAGHPPTVHHSNVRHDATLQQVLCCLQEMSEQNGKVLVAVSRLQFLLCLGRHPYAATAGNLTKSPNMPSALSWNLSDGNFDLLIIQRRYGLVPLEMMGFGENPEKLKMSCLDLDNNIRQTLKDAVSQLDKPEGMLSHVASDVTPGLRITKTIAVSNLTARQVQQAISGDPQLTQDVYWCLGTAGSVDITDLPLCSDQLSDPRTPCDVSSDVLRELGNWWQRRVAVSGSDSHMTCDLYKTLVASQETGVIPPGQPHLLQCDFTKKRNLEKALNDLSQAASGGPRCTSSPMKLGYVVRRQQ